MIIPFKSIPSYIVSVIYSEIVSKASNAILDFSVSHDLIDAFFVFSIISIVGMNNSIAKRLHNPAPASILITAGCIPTIIDTWVS